MMKNVIALVVTFNRKDFLAKVLTSLVNQSYPLREIIIVDNNSNDGTFLLVDEFIKSSHSNIAISYFNTGDNLGGAGGFSYGFDVVKSKIYDYLWLMDDDLSPEVTCLENLLLTGNEGITQPVRYNLDGSCAEISPVIYDLSNPFLMNPKLSTVKDYLEGSENNHSFEIAGVPFEGPLISHRLIDIVGKPDERFFIFNDDLDFSIRAKSAGFKIICEPKAKAIRLLVNHQKNDLKSWKGYFMLRNHFFILSTHGESFLVRSRPLFLALGYFCLSIIRGDIKAATMCFNAYIDSFSLKNNDKYRP
ncbi:GT2 family glycosyltransferase [Rahnella sp. BIGb0236]|uniref:glycosyltransferase n=1 Tax=Rahnella sp. BIGb0236 TaxID=2485117 RepID=UPI001062184F|nr:glycosyltransferase [Rahnella sp. BIGb0236]TDS88341.1 GT2 family glycosyltransferase [Rahnella sp. BIGb0236]VTQ62330.1 UDP-galactofuranosyl transferase GlfT1 [Campylobacter jejuni]